MKRFTQEAEFARNVVVCDGAYEPEKFYAIAKGLEKEPERGRRCYKCYELRLEETARYAKEHGFDIFTTTLSISPHKNAAWLNEIGERMAEKYGVAYLYSDFKKKKWICSFHRAVTGVSPVPAGLLWMYLQPLGKGRTKEE